jgi:hypothetical protein
MSKINPQHGPGPVHVSRNHAPLPDPATAPVDDALTERVFQAHRQMAATTAMLTQEMVDFTSRRMRAQSDFVGELLRCADLPTVMATQFRFVADTSRDYAEEINRIACSLRTTMEPEPTKETATAA